MAIYWESICAGCGDFLADHAESIEVGVTGDLYCSPDCRHERECEIWELSAGYALGGSVRSAACWGGAA